MATDLYEREYQKLARLIELATILSQQADFQEILRVVAQKAASLLNAETAVIMMINPQTRQTVKTIFKEGQAGDQRRFDTVQKHVSGWVIKNQQSFASANLKTDPRFAKNLFESIPIQSVLAVLLRVEGITLGTLILLNISQQPATSRSAAETPSRRGNQPQATSNQHLDQSLWVKFPKVGEKVL